MSQRPFDPFTVPLDGVSLIEASAGTGKTYSIATLYLRLLLEKRLTAREILVVTFTEAATAELRERIRARLRAACRAFDQAVRTPDDGVLRRLVESSRDRQADFMQLRRALADLDEAPISTIHGFCSRMLREAAFESGMPLDLELTADVDDLVRENVEDYVSGRGHDGDLRLVGFYRENFSVAGLLALARLAVRHRDYPLVPPVPAEAEVVGLLEQAAVLYGRAAGLWAADNVAIRQELTPTDRFLKDTRRLLADGLADRLAAYLSGKEPPEFLLPKEWGRFVPEVFRDREGGICSVRAIKSNDLPKHPFFSVWQDYVAVLAAAQDGLRRRYLAGLVEHVRVRLPAGLRLRRLLSFDELLYCLDRALQVFPAGADLAALIRRRFPAALIDEFQDTDPVQYRIFRTIYGGQPDRTLFMIGDPKQAIYAFRGADIYAYLAAAEHAGAAVYTMPVNWRSGPALVRAVNALFGGRKRPFYEARIPFPAVTARPGARDDEWQSGTPGEAPLQFLCLLPEMAGRADSMVPAGWLEENIPGLAAAEIATLLAGEARVDGRPLSPGDVAVLVRTNEQAAAIQAALRSRRVVSVLQSRVSVFESGEAEALQRLLLAVADPANEPALRAALATPFFGLTAADFLALDNDERRGQEIFASFQHWQEIWHEKGLMAMARVLVEETGLAERLLGFTDGERRMTNLRHLLELLHGRQREMEFGPAELVRWFAERRVRAEASEEAELRLESDAEAVQIVTVHRSKGLEYPVVFCPYLWEAKVEAASFRCHVFHDPLAEWSGRLAVAPDETGARRRREEVFAENLRLLYVAVTRARHCCLIIWSPVRRYEETALAYLLHVPDADEDRSLAEWFTVLRRRSPAELFDELAARVRKTGTWTLRTVGSVTGLPSLRPAGETILACRTDLPAVRDDWRIASFSGLTAGSEGGRATAFEEGRDVADSRAGAFSLPPSTGEEIVLTGFPAGVAAGNFFHRVLERLDFQAIDREESGRIVAQELDAAGFVAGRWLEPLLHVFREVVGARLHPELPLRLQDVPLSRRLVELPFHFPLGDAKDAVRFDAAELAEVFRAWPSPGADGYAAEVAALNFAPLRGFMHGFIDLVFQHDGRWYLIDYKSNHLGGRYPDYAEDFLRAAMREHHYYLQYHIYTVAVHRYLRWRRRDYDYDRDFGGVFYLFLRGMAAQQPAGQAVFFDRPPRGRIVALDRLFAGSKWRNGEEARERSA